MKPKSWQLKMEKLLHIEDQSLKKELGKTKRNEIQRLKKLNSFLKLIHEGVYPSFFYFYKQSNY